MPSLSTRVIVMIVAAVLLVGIILFGVRQCDLRRSDAARARVERSQADAASNSAADAVNTVAASGQASAASEQLTRDNERQIRAAPGANVVVSDEVDAAGRASLCRRDAYRNTLACQGKAE